MDIYIVAYIMNNDPYFSWQNFSEIAGIDAHIDFASQVIDKYEWRDEKHVSLLAQLNRIKEKQADKLLNISFIGEFSSGKSTFLNALLRCDLLAANVLQGTTIAITIMEYSPTYYITLLSKEGKDQHYVFPDLPSLKVSLEDLTTNPNKGRGIHAVRVGLPSPTLKKGFRMIDTPGTNAIELWHEKITETAIKEYSDLSVVVVDACRPLPETLCAFVNENLSGVISNCAFVLTKTDLVREKDRKPLLLFMENKIKQEFDVKQPFVVSYTSTEVLNSFIPGFINRSDPHLLNESLNNEEVLLAYTGKQKAQAQARKLAQLTANVYKDLSVQLKKLNTILSDELQLLERTKHTDLAPFIMSQKDQRMTGFRQAAYNCKFDFSKDLDKYTTKAKTKIMSNVTSCADLDAMKNYVNDDLTDDCVDQAKAILEKCEKRYVNIRKCYKEEIKEFQTLFEKEFKDLKILRVSLSISHTTLPVHKSSNTANMAAAAHFIKEELSKEKWAFGGGAAAGAALGTMFAPGIGTVLGAVAGFFAGAVMAPDDEKVKASLKSKLKQPLNSYFRTICSRALADMDKYILKLESKISQEIDKYYMKYNQTIDMRIAEWEVHRKSLEAGITDLSSDLNNIDNRKQTINSILEQMMMGKD